VIQVSDIPVVWHIIWNATATLVCIIITSLLLDKAGFFEWAALHVARWGGGSGKRLFVLLVLLGPWYQAVCQRQRGADPDADRDRHAAPLAFRRATLAFVMAAGFVSDTASCR
jgi:arsenical pump membrane protein